jgi:hypothetical protein
VQFLNHTGTSFTTGAGSFDPTTRKVKFFQSSPYVLTSSGPKSSFGAFSRPAAGTFGNVRRDSYLGPSFFNTDFSVAKTFTLREQLKLQMRAEAFNVFNHVNLGQPDTCIDCQDGNAGYISSIVSSQDGSSMRRLQFAARIQF